MISVLIPAYNAEKTIKACLDSVLAQTFQGFEIVVINDGSTDTTAEILNAYAERDSRIHVLHQENAGLAAVRNRLVRESRGEMLTFLDSDDRILPGYLERLYSVRMTTGVSCVCCNHMIVQGNRRRPRFTTGSNVEVLSAECALKNILYHGIPDVCAWAKLYSRDLLTQINYPEGRLFEDTYVIADVILRAGQVAFVSEPLYEYMVYAGSISRSCNEAHIWDYCMAVENMTGIIISHFPHTEQGCTRRKAHALMSVMRTLDPARHNSEWKKAYAVLRGYASEVLRDRKAPKRDKFGILATMPGLKFYRFIWDCYEIIRRTYA